ncbi:MAG: queuosine precursor transporter [Spirochaetales bacterium]|nr:queuosine precursor transporter [Spirochaetales bacterium]
MEKSKKGPSSQDWLIGLALVYGVVAVTMNIFCMKSLSYGSPIIISDGGLLVSWMVFLISNIIVEVWDEKTSVRIVSITAVVSFFIMLIGRLEVFIPSLPEYEEQSKAFAQIFSNGPRTIVASVAAFWVGNFVNVHIISRIKAPLERKGSDNGFLFFLRAAFSTVVGQFVDNMLFMVLAFAPIGLSVYEMAWKDIFSAAISGTFIELAVEAFFVPLITIPLTKRIKAIKAREVA